MKKNEKHALVIVFLITIFQLGNYAFAQNVFPTGTGTFVGIGTTIPNVNLEVKGDVKFKDPTSLEEISFGRPGAQNGFNLTSVLGSNAYFRFDGLSLRLLTKPSGGTLINTAGIAIEADKGWVGLGTTTPACRFQLNDNTSTSFGSYFNTNSIGPTLFVERNSSGSSNPILPSTTFFNPTNNGSVFLNSHQSSEPGSLMTCAYFENTVPEYRGFGVGITAVASHSNREPWQQSYTNTGIVTVAERAVQAFGLTAAAYGTETSCGIYSTGEGSSNKNYGVFGLGIGSTKDCSDAYGVYGEARAGQNNYGIYGTAGPAGNIDCTLPNTIWAGYFAGDVFATGSFIPSDKQFKENITTLNNAINIISKLNPQTYTFKKSDDFLGLSLPEGLRYGFIAQELETILPSLVKKSHNPEIKDKDGKLISKSFDFKAVDYTALIPILIEGIKEQQVQIDELKNQLKNNLKDSKPNKNGTANELSEAILYQNAPNPFSENTTIKYHLANIGDDASIMIFDMNGKLLKTYDLNTQNLDGDVQILSGTLIAGMYYYSLVIKGKEISTLKMILAK